MAVIAAAPQGRAHAWLVPAMAAAACLAIATWVLVPSRVTDDGSATTTARHEAAPEAPRAATESSVGGRTVETMTPAPGAIALNTSAQTTTRDTAPAPAAMALVWTDTPVAEIPMLPPLAGPPPLVIEPIAWDEMTIVPLNVALIEVEALAIEPLDVSDLNGV